jgi:hypothetical protein
MSEMRCGAAELRNFYAIVAGKCAMGGVLGDSIHNEGVKFVRCLFAATTSPPTQLLKTRFFKILLSRISGQIYSKV